MSRPVVEVNPDPIPDELKERDQWLLWDARADRPRQPHWAGNFSISWSDPADWHSFEEAVELAETKASWGIGYVTAADSTNYSRGLYGVVDLDGCADENGSPNDWVPSFEPFAERDAYIEWSPSGTGIHIPVWNMQVPEWWSDIEGDGDHVGVDVLTNKFCTFTGDTMRGAGEEVVESGDWIDEFLADAYEGLTGETAPPRRDSNLNGYNQSSGGSKPIDSDELTEEQVENLLSHVSGSQHYNDWRDTAYAVHSWNDGAKGKRLFENWSRTNPKWEKKESQRVIDWIWENANQNGGIGVGTLFHHAKKGGWKPEKNDGGPPTWKKLVAEESDRYDSHEEVPDDPADLEPPEEAEGDEDHEKEPTEEVAAVQDGGTQTATADAQPSAGPEWTVGPSSVLRVALSDARIPLETDDDEDVTLRDLRQSEAAYATWKVLEKTGFDRRLLGVSGGGVYGCDDGVWSRETGDELFREKAVDALGPAFSKGVKADMEEHLRRAQTYLADELGAPDATVATKTGLLDLEELEEEELKPSHLALHRIPHEFDEGADERPRFDQFISDSVKESDRKKLQEYAGYLLWQHAQPYGKALFLVGPTDSGKGTFLRVLKGVIGREALASESLDDLTESRWGAAQLYGSWANIRNEVTPGEVKKVERFKELTGGGDRISAEFKGEQKFEFDVTQKFIFAMNQMPEVSGADGAFWNRLLFAEFPDTVADEDKVEELAAKIVDEEGSAVLNWMLHGLQRLRENGGQFTNERDTDAKKELCNAFGGSFDRFMQDVVDQTGDDGHWVEKRDLFELAEAYANYKDMEPEWSNQGHFTRMLGREGVRHDRTRHVSEDGDKIGIYQGVQVPSWAVEELEVDVNQGATLGAEDHESGTQSTL